MSNKLFVGNANNIFVRNLRNAITGVVDTSATLTFTLQDSEGNNVDDAVDIAMPHIAAGLYVGVLPGSVDLEHKAEYVVVITDDDESLRWEMPAVAWTRTMSDSN